MPDLHRKRSTPTDIEEAESVESLLYASHMESQGIRLFQAICEQDCEGIVGKYKRGTYTAAPTSWVKILNPNYSQKRERREMFQNFRERSAAAGSSA
jgi:ATP-dependent DNA ligase